MTTPESPALEALTTWSLRRGQFVGLVVGPTAIAVATSGHEPAVLDRGQVGALASIDADVRPRWVLWSAGDVRGLVDDDLRLRSSWDLTAVHGLLHGEWRRGPYAVWARAAGRSPGPAPTTGPRDLFHQELGIDEGTGGPLLGDGRLHPDWAPGDNTGPDRIGAWAVLAVTAAERQRSQLAELVERPMALVTAHAESTAELLCSELAHDGLPFDRDTAESIVAGFVGARPLDDADAARVAC